MSCPLPIRWLAIESMNENRFSEKSDVYGWIQLICTTFYLNLSWSFGIVLYEMYTFGREPYESVPLKQLKTFLNSGHRMNKPTYADDNMFVIIYYYSIYKAFQLRVNDAMLARETR